MKFISNLICAAIVALPLTAVSNQLSDNQVLTEKQKGLLDFAYETARSDGHKNPQYVLGILMQETRVGESKDYRVAGPKTMKEKVFGIAQVKLQAALAVMKRWPEMWKFLDTHTKEELQARLILDDKFNIRVASKYALLMGMNDHPNLAIASYNLGHNGAERVNPQTYRYTVLVKQHAAMLEKYTSSGD